MNKKHPNDSDSINYIVNYYDNFKSLSSLAIDEVRNYLNHGKMSIQSFKKGQIIHLEGEKCRGAEIIIKGVVVIERITESGDLMTITVFNPDDMLGGNLIFSKNPFYPLTVTARTDVTILSIEKSLLLELCEKNHDFLRIFLEYISDHTLLLGDKIKNYTNRSIRERLLIYLENEAKIQGSNRILLKTTKKELADKFGIQRTSLSRELQKMKNDGIIDFDKNSITIII